MIYGGLGCAALMMVAGLGVQVVGESVGTEQIAASAEAIHHDVRDAALPEVDVSMAELLNDPAVQRAIAERAVGPATSVPSGHWAVSALIDGAQRQLLEQQYRQMCDAHAEIRLPAEDCTIAHSFIATDFSAFGPGGVHYAGLTGSDPTAKDAAFKALFGTMGMDDETYDQVFNDIETH